MAVKDPPDMLPTKKRKKKAKKRGKYRRKKKKKKETTAGSYVEGAPCRLPPSIGAPLRLRPIQLCALLHRRGVRTVGHVPGRRATASAQQWPLVLGHLVGSGLFVGVGVGLGWGCVVVGVGDGGGGGGGGGSGNF